jgi:hypothetical protein
MAGQLLLINPRRRRRNPHHAKRRHNPHAHHARRRRRNPMHMPSWLAHAKRNPHRRRARRHNPAHFFKRRSHRRHNPVSGRGLMKEAGQMVMAAGGMAVGAIALDYLFGFVNNQLPATLKRSPGTMGMGDAVKVMFNVAVGSMVPGKMRRFAKAAAEGSMTVHFYQLISQNLPTTVQAGLAQSMGWYQPAPVTAGTQWVGPNRGRVRRASPLLSMFSSGSPSLSMVPTVASPFNVPMVVGGQAGVPIR